MIRKPAIVLTSNARLARDLTLAHARLQHEAGIEAWQKLEIMTIDLWLGSLQEEIFVTQPEGAVPLRNAQARLLWQSIIEKDVLVGQAGLAKMAQKAWQTLHEHKLLLPRAWSALALSEDQETFRRWAIAYEDQCHATNLTDYPQFLTQLPAQISAGHVDLPSKITLKGFDLEPAPIIRDILEAMRHQGVQIEQRSTADTQSIKTLSVHACVHVSDELTRAAKWARQQIEADSSKRVAIVVPSLDKVLALAEKTMRAVLDPEGMCLAQSSHPLWHISLGQPLAQHPMIADILHILSLDPKRVNQPDLHRLLRSPWLCGWSDERRKRFRFILYLTDRQPYWLDWSSIIKKAEHYGCTQWAKYLKAWHKIRLKSPKLSGATSWSEQYQKELSAIGFGFGRPLDRIEHQALRSWHRVLEGLGEINASEETSMNSMSRGKISQQLRVMAQEVIFREQDLGAPISVLGVREALGSQFDAAWLTQMDQETWPAPPRRDPFIPIPLQSGIPTSTAQGCLDLAKEQLKSLLAIAPSLEASYALGEEEIKPSPTPLLVSLVSIKHYAQPEMVHGMEPHPAGLQGVMSDTQAPHLDQKHTRGGVRLLNDQSACPFKAFVTHRLQAKDHRIPRPGINPKDRGILVHDILECFWLEVKDAKGLQALDDAALKTKVESQTEACIHAFVQKYPQSLTDTEQKLEKENLTRRIHEWLTIERKRGDFETEHLEESMTLEVGPLTLDGTPDRIDQLADGRRIVIDYKTGKTSRSQWSPEDRLRDTQLPLYALTLNPAPTAIAFAKLEKNGSKFEGISDSDLDIEGIGPISVIKREPFKAIDSWSQLLKAWRAQLDLLAHEFQRGRADVAPVKPEICRHCHLKAVCRIKERSIWSDDLSEDADDD